MRLFVLCALACVCSRGWAQLQYSDVFFSVTSDAYASQGVSPFDTAEDSDERERDISGRFDNILSSGASIAGGTGQSTVTLVAGAEASRIEFVCEMDAGASVGGQSDEASGGGSAGMGATFSVNQEFVASISASAEMFPDAGAPFGTNVTLGSATVTGFNPAKPTEFVQFSFDLNTLFNPGTNEAQFFEVITLKPGFNYTVAVGAGVSAMASDSGPASSEARALVNFLMVLDDQDEDGLVDTWETEGIDADGDGDIELDLPAMGADPMRKTLFVEVDSQSGWPVSQGDLDAVAASFANAPVANPDGSEGITLVFERDELDLPATTYNDSDIPPRSSDIPTKLGGLKDAHFGTPAQRTDDESDLILDAKRASFRYLVYGGRYNITVMGTSGPVVTQSSGFAEINGNDFLVSPDGIGFQPGDAARTIMHELGHTLGLKHGGGDEVQFKPNYISVMNYAHQIAINSTQPFLVAYNAQLALDYSREALPTLNESALDESSGVVASEPSLVGRRFMYSSFTQGGGLYKFIGTAGTGSTPVDWDNSGAVSAGTVPEDINNIRNASGSNATQMLQGHNDWANLALAPRGGPNFGRGAIALGESTLGTPEYTVMLRDEITVGLGDTGTAPCPPDLDANGTLDFFDLSIFLSTTPDWDENTSFDFFDLSGFLSDYNAGCP